MARKRQARRCTAHRTEGSPCGAWAVAGATVCAAHGGRAPQVQAAAAQRIEARKAATLAGAVLGRDLGDDIAPGEMLLDMIRKSYALVGFYAEQIAGLDAEQLVWGLAGRDVHQAGGATGPTDVLVHQSGRPNIWLVLHQQERNTLRGLIETAARCGLEARLVRQAELEADMMVRLITAILYDPLLEMQPDQRAQFGAVIPKHIRAVCGGDRQPEADDAR